MHSVLYILLTTTLASLLLSKSQRLSDSKTRSHLGEQTTPQKQGHGRATQRHQVQRHRILLSNSKLCLCLCRGSHDFPEKKNRAETPPEKGTSQQKLKLG